MVEKQQKSVCIIGAGAAGLCALRHFTTRPESFHPVVCYEKTNQIGGTWNYTERVGTDKNGLPVHTSMYRDMRTNLPMEIMAFPDFSWNKPPEARSYVEHGIVLKYLHDYADHFKLRQYIKFEHPLIRLNRDQGAWKAKVHDLVAEQVRTEHFDIVLLCPGRYCVPLWPDIESLSQFTGSVIHSHDYRHPEPYTGQRVAVIGGGPSGVDIALEVAAVAKEVLFVCSHDKFKLNHAENFNQIKGRVLEFSEEAIKIQINEELREFPIDSLILATGYRFNLEFLDKESAGVKILPDETLEGIYRHFISIEQPSLAIVSVLKAVLPFPLFHQQILYFMKVHLGEISLPTKEAMRASEKHDLEIRNSLGFRDKDRHLVNFDLFDQYLEDIAKDGQLEPLPSITLKLYRALGPIRMQNLVTYKDKNYQIVDNDNFKEIE